jgi:hypothetical protein
MNEQTSETGDFRARARARGEAKNAAARAALQPLAAGERPLAVTVAAIAAMVLAVGNAAAYLASNGGGDTSQKVRQLVLICGVLVIASIGMWLRKYWAVLGFQTILGLQIIAYCLALTRIDSVVVAAIFVAIIAASGVLFWFLIRAMARIQMPEGPNQRALRERLDEIERDETVDD